MLMFDKKYIYFHIQYEFKILGVEHPQQQKHIPNCLLKTKKSAVHLLLHTCGTTDTDCSYWSRRLHRAQL